jgi:mono/diheme cytochrome c family protein
MAMIITMALPTLGLIFFFLPFWTALLSYLCCLILSGLMYYGMFSVIGGRRKVQSGFKKMTGEETWVIADIDPEGKVEIEDEIWKATTRGRPFNHEKGGVRMIRILIAVLIATFFGETMLWAQSSKKGEYEQGKGIYTNNCQICHGANGKGDGPAAASFSPRPANFTDPAFWQRKDIDKFITDTVENGHGMMPPIALKDSDIKAVIDYISHTFKPGK